MEIVWEANIGRKMEGLGNLSPGEPLCQIYETEDQFWAVLIPFLKEGLEKGEKVMYGCSLHSPRSISARLRAAGVSTAIFLRKGQLRISRKNVYPPKGIFNADRAIARLIRETEQAQAEGYRGIRFAGEPEALFGSPSRLRSWTEYMIRLSDFLSGKECLALCQYRRDRFRPEILLRLSQFYPFVIVGTTVCRNVQPVSPGDFLKDDPGKIALDYAFRNLVQYRRAEEALKASWEEHRAIFEHANLPMVVAKNGMIRFVNSRLLEITGYRREELLSRPFLNFIHPEDRESLMARRLTEVPGEEHPPSTDLSIRVSKKDGNSIWTEVRSAQISWKGSPAILHLLTDISERKRAEEQQRVLAMRLRRAQKVETLGRLAGGVVHSFNNLLSIIKGLAEACLEDAGEGSPLKKNLVMIKDATDRGTELGKHLLAFSREQLIETKIIDLNQLLKGMEIMLRAVTGKVEVKIDPAARWGRIKADPHQIEQALINLAVNAKEAMPSGGKLMIETSNVTLDEASSHPGHYVMLSVRDTGVGISPEVKERIFEPFFTTKEKGAGLGLSIVDGVVKQSRGHIRVESEPDKGATFKIYFPSMDAEEKLAPSHPVPNGGK
jgi:PAS domain S-box-containing protein